MLQPLRCPIGDHSGIHLHAEVHGWIVKFDLSEEGLRGNRDTEFFPAFPNQRLLRSFAGFNFAARKLPHPGQRLSLGTAADQQPAVLLDHRRHYIHCFSFHKNPSFV